jgi:hypothetical protein
VHTLRYAMLLQPHVNFWWYNSHITLVGFWMWG